MKCLEVIFIRVRIKGYLKNITEDDILTFEAKGIKSKNKISYSNDNIKYTIKINSNKVLLIREGNDFLNTFVFNNKKSVSNYLLKDNNYDIEIEVNCKDIVISDSSIYIRYEIVDTKCEYEFKIEMSDIL